MLTVVTQTFLANVIITIVVRKGYDGHATSLKRKKAILHFTGITRVFAGGEGEGEGRRRWGAETII